jgi:hypothetical protein
VTPSCVGEVLPGLWRFETLHPEWTEDEGGEDGWEQKVAWWALGLPQGLALVDPLVVDWRELDELVDQYGGCAAVIRTVHWHERSVAEAAARYSASIYAKRPPSPTRPDGRDWPRLDRALRDRDEPLDGLQAYDLERSDELALWLPAQRALVFGDAMLRRPTGELRVCPDSWLQPEGGPARLRELLRRLTELPVEHVLVAHGPLVLGDGRAALSSAT